MAGSLAAEVAEMGAVPVSRVFRQGTALPATRMSVEHVLFSHIPALAARRDAPFAFPLPKPTHPGASRHVTPRVLILHSQDFTPLQRGGKFIRRGAQDDGD